MRTSLVRYTLNGQPIDAPRATHPDPDVVTWTSGKLTPEKATHALAIEVERQAARGFVLRSSFMSGAGRSKRSWTFGLLRFLLPARVEATAVFHRAARHG